MTDIKHRFSATIIIVTISKKRGGLAAVVWYFGLIVSDCHIRRISLIKYSN